MFVARRQRMRENNDDGDSKEDGCHLFVLRGASLITRRQLMRPLELKEYSSV